MAPFHRLFYKVAFYLGIKGPGLLTKVAETFPSGFALLSNKWLHAVKHLNHNIIAKLHFINIIDMDITQNDIF